MLRAVVFLNGDLDLDAVKCRSMVSEKDYVFCADGGTRHARALGLIPLLVMGDMDSTDRETIQWLDAHGVEIRRFSAEKDYSDTELLMDCVLQKGFRKIMVFGATGGRLDHQFANLMLLEKWSLGGASVRLVNAQGFVEGVREGSNVNLDDMQCHTMSFFPLSDTAVVSLEGFRYGLRLATIHRGSTIGLSNIVECEHSVVRVHSGTIILMVQKDGENENAVL